MQRTAIAAFLLWCFVLSGQVWAYEFENFQVKGALKTLHKLSDSYDDKKGRRKLKEKDIAKARLAQKEIGRLLLGLDEVGNLRDKSLGGKSSDDNYSLIFKKIQELIGNNYNQIGDEQSSPLVLNHNIGGGIMNFSGFTWQKPQANFKLYANRELAPDLFSDRWIVHDTFVIGINASTLLTNMRDVDLIDISDQGIAAFAGVEFMRTYHYWHFADTFILGLQADYSKLFLNWAKFNSRHALDGMIPYELMRKQDQFSFNAGGFVNSPPYYGFSLRGGVIASVAFENEVSLQAVGPNDFPREGEFLRYSLDKKFDAAVNVHLGLQVDFFELLKITLLSFDLEYSYGKSKKLHLSFYENNRNELKNNPDGKREFKRLIRGFRDDVNYWRGNIVQEDERIEQNLNSKYSVLLYGSLRKKETQQIKVVKDGIEKVFFKNYSESIKLIQNLWSRIFGTIIYALFEFETTVKNAAETVKKMVIEYEHQQSLGTSIVDDEDKFSIVLTQKFAAAKTHRWIDGLYRREAVRHLSRYTNLESVYIDMFNNKQLRGPMSFTASYRIERAGLEYFNFLHENQVFEAIVDICKTTRRSKWLNPRKRRKMLRRPQIGKSACVKRIGNRYLDYSGEFHRFGRINLMKFKRFMGSYYKKIRTYKDIYRIFGEENVFMNGDISATTKDGIPFQSYFKSGQFRGLGVIDSFMREGGTIVPVPISE
jgi:hypothetical protein